MTHILGPASSSCPGAVHLRANPQPLAPVSPRSFVTFYALLFCLEQACRRGAGCRCQGLSLQSASRSIHFALSPRFCASQPLRLSWLFSTPSRLVSLQPPNRPTACILIQYPYFQVVDLPKASIATTTSTACRCPRKPTNWPDPVQRALYKLRRLFS